MCGRRLSSVFVARLGSSIVPVVTVAQVQKGTQSNNVCLLVPTKDKTHIRLGNCFFSLVTSLTDLVKRRMGEGAEIGPPQRHPLT